MINPDDEREKALHESKDIATELEEVANMILGNPELNHQAAERLMRIARDIPPRCCSRQETVAGSAEETLGDDIYDAHARDLRSPSALLAQRGEEGFDLARSPDRVEDGHGQAPFPSPLI